MTRICWVSVAPGWTSEFDIGSICSCCDYKCGVRTFHAIQIYHTHLRYRRLESKSSHRRTSRYLEPRQNIDDARALRVRLWRQRDLELVLVVSRVSRQFRRGRLSRWCLRLRQAERRGSERLNDRLNGSSGWSSSCRCTAAKQAQDVVDGTFGRGSSGRSRSRTGGEGRRAAEYLGEQVCVTLSCGRGSRRSVDAVGGSRRRHIVPEEVVLQRL